MVCLSALNASKDNESNIENTNIKHLVTILQKECLKPLINRYLKTYSNSFNVIENTNVIAGMNPAPYLSKQHPINY